MNLPYFLIGIARRYAPNKLLFEIMKWRGDGSVAENEPERSFAQWKAQLDRHEVDPIDKHVMEFGSGRYARAALYMLKLGVARVTLVDFYATSLDEPVHRRMLEQDCEHLGLDPKLAFQRITVYSGDLLKLPLPPPDERPDLVTSSAVLEHVRDPKAIFACCFAWLKSGGATVHMIDMRDHNMQFRYPYEMLTFSERVWNRWFNLRGGFHLNRWRAHKYVEALGMAGFTRICYDAFMRNEQEFLDIKSRLHPHFRCLPDSMLTILGMYIYGEKPTTGR